MAQGKDFFPAIGSIVDRMQSDEGVDDSTTTPEDGEDDEKLLEVINSMCMKCGEEGVTRMLLTNIPFFREVIVMSFQCDHCGWTNNEIQSAGTIRPEGTLYTTKVLSVADLNRQLIRSSTCSIIIPEFELTLPASGRGQLTTIEGLLRDIIADLSSDQSLRRVQDEVSYNAIESLLEKLRNLVGEEEDEDGQKTNRLLEHDGHIQSFTLKLDDPAGNSFIEFIGSMADPKWNMRMYPRSRQQSVDLGLISPDDELANGGDAEPDSASKIGKTLEQASNGEDIANEEIFAFPGVCSSCGHSLETRMKKVVIPYFKDIIIMSTNCDRCGYRDNEVKSGSAISEKGKKITLKVEDKEDLSRDILKSETSGLMIPEIDLVLQPGTLGGRFTTLEGILDQIYEELSEKVFSAGDSSTPQGRQIFHEFLEGLKNIKSVERPFTLILDDPLANSYVQNLYAPDPDPNMEIELYDRTWQQNEDLGLNDMKVEGYEQDANALTADMAEGPLEEIRPPTN